MEYILCALLAVFTTLQLETFSLSFVSPKEPNKRIKRIFSAYLFLAIPQLLYTTAFFPLFNKHEGIWELSIVTLYYILFYEIKLVNSIFFSSLFLILVWGLDFAYLSIFSFSLDLNITEIIYSIPLFCIYSFSSAFFIYSILFLINRYFRFRKKQINMSGTQWFQIILYTLFCFLSLTYILVYAYQNDQNNITHVIYAAVSILITAIMYYLVTKLSEENEIRQQNALLNQQIKMGIENIAALNSAYAQQRKLTHDFNNHLSVIRSLLESGDTAQAKEYTGSLLASSISVTRLFDSGNTIVDTLLTQKYNHAKELGIKMQVLVEDLSQVAMSSENLVVVLSNLLDNAIEACMNTSGEKMIKVKFVLEDMGHILTVQNTAPNTPQAENRQFTTTKADRLNHGYGIKNISSVLDSYGYPHSFNYENGIFTFTAIMVG